MQFFMLDFYRVALLSLGVALSIPVGSQTLNCKGDFAQVGNSKGTILQKCGEPVLKDSFCKPADRNALPSGAVVINSCEKIDEWTYNPGYGQFMTMLQFEGGELKRIKYGDRVMR